MGITGDTHIFQITRDKTEICLTDHEGQDRDLFNPVGFKYACLQVSKQTARASFFSQETDMLGILQRALSSLQLVVLTAMKRGKETKK
jgi:hypothetical protein